MFFILKKHTDKKNYKFFKTINSKLNGRKKKLSGKTTKYINYFFLKKKKVEEQIYYNSIKRKQLKGVSFPFHIICNLKNDKLKFLKKCNLSENKYTKENISTQHEKRSSISQIEEIKHVNEDIDRNLNGNLRNIQDENTRKSQVIMHDKNYLYEEENKLLDLYKDEHIFFPKMNIKKDRKLKDLKNMNNINNVIEIRKNKDVCNIYLITSLINIYHDNNYNYLVLKILREIKYIYYMNIKQISLIIYNLYKYYFINYIKNIFYNYDIINFNSFYNYYYILDDFIYNENMKYQLIDLNLIKQFLISLSHHIKKDIYYETDFNILSKIIFVFSYFSVNDKKLNELLIDRIFKSLHIKKNKKIKYFSLISLSFEKLRLYYSKFTFTHSYIIIKKMNKLSRKYGNTVIYKKKKLKKINLFDLHKKNPKIPLIELKDIFTYMYIINKNNLKNNQFIMVLLKYFNLFFKKNFTKEKDMYLYSYILNYNNNFYKENNFSINEKITSNSIYYNSLKNTKIENFNEDKKKKLLLNSYNGIILKRRRNKKLNKYLALYSLYNINKNAQLIDSSKNNYANNTLIHIEKINNNIDNNLRESKKKKDKIDLQDNNSFKKKECKTLIQDNFISREKVKKISESDLESKNKDKMEYRNDTISPLMKNNNILITNNSFKNNYEVDLISLIILLSHLISYDYLFLKKIPILHNLIKLYLDLIRITNLKHIHFFYISKIIQINGYMNIYNNFITKIIYSSIFFKCKNISLFHTGALNFDVENLCYYLIILYQKLLKIKIKDYNLNNVIYIYLIKFLEKFKKFSYILLYRYLKLLYSVKNCNGHKNSDKNKLIIYNYKKCSLLYDKKNYNISHENISLDKKLEFLIYENLILLKWNYIDNSYLLKFYKYINKLKLQGSDGEMKKKLGNVYKKLQNVIKEKIYNINLFDLMKLYINTNNELKRKVFHLEYLFNNLLSINNIEKMDDSNFILFFKTTFSYMYLNSTYTKRFFIKNFDCLKLIKLNRNYIEKNIEKIKKKYIYLIIIYNFFYLCLLFQKNIGYHKKNTNINHLETLFEIINKCLENWYFTNDEKNALIYIFLLYFNSLRKKKKHFFFIGKHSKKFVGISKKCIEEMDKLLNSYFNNSYTTYINPLLLFFLFKYKIFLNNYNRKKIKLMEKVINNQMIYYSMLNSKNDFIFLETIFYAITKNNFILKNELFDDFTNLYFNKITFKSFISNSFEKHREKNYFDLLEIIKLNILYKSENNNKNIIYNFITRRRSIEYSMKTVLNKNYEIFLL
ncbi:conserved Plasmodium protein, unknown function [Plasmodium relictum]|uniref:Uncharacterized protein n=1 Tax=Plasmodium relictum TaxID=85471 RepID=A0A1J1HAS2_PLARL|nr:conserved Plasmodium protein, unknown function [Plasmodium relictum]CRH00538.1 conserved Plasmodium protein, unknown function [Plasmodium relictum]